MPLGMHVDLGAFSYLDGERSDGTGAPGLFIVDGKTKALVKRDESFGVRRGHSNVVNTHGWHLYPPSRSCDSYSRRTAHFGYVLSCLPLSCNTALLATVRGLPR